MKIHFQKIRFFNILCLENYSFLLYFYYSGNVFENVHGLTFKFDHNIVIIYNFWQSYFSLITVFHKK